MNQNSVDAPQLMGTKAFTFEEMRKCANNFSVANDVGGGGYGQVYKGILPNGQLIAIKRAQPGSLQGALEFKTEIELLSRVHHKNVVKLLGFCFDRGEQMLVYEYIPNGSLRDSLSGNIKSLPSLKKLFCIEPENKMQAKVGLDLIGQEGLE